MYAYVHPEVMFCFFLFFFTCFYRDVFPRRSDVYVVSMSSSVACCQAVYGDRSATSCIVDVVCRLTMIPHGTKIYLLDEMER